jgi:hypothetical protein
VRPRRKTPELVKQEFYGISLPLCPARKLLTEAGLQKYLNPDRPSPAHSIRNNRRKMKPPPVLYPSGRTEEAQSVDI